LILLHFGFVSDRTALASKGEDTKLHFRSARSVSDITTQQQYPSMLDVGIPLIIQDRNRNPSGHMRSDRVRPRQDAGIIHDIVMLINNKVDDSNFSHDIMTTTTTIDTTEEEYADSIPDTPWTSCMPIDASSFKFVEQFEWPSSFTIIPQQEQPQKPKWNKVCLYYCVVKTT
jgi:hypothetical protein